MQPTRQTVVITDHDYGDVDIERAIIEDAGLRLVAADCKTEDDVIEAARDADAIIAQYATVGAKAIDGGPIGLVEDNDLIEINAPERRLAIVGVDGEHRPPDEVEEILAQRRSIWKPPRPRHDSGILSLYSRVARSASEGASIT